MNVVREPNPRHVLTMPHVPKGVNLAHNVGVVKDLFCHVYGCKIEECMKKGSILNRNGHFTHVYLREVTVHEFGPSLIRHQHKSLLVPFRVILLCLQL